MSNAASAVCPRCRQPLASADDLACPSCGALVHGAALEQLSAEAQWQEAYDPARAIALWEQCLKRLPQRSRQYEAIAQRIERLRASPQSSGAGPEPGAMPIVRPEKWNTAILKTGISMAVSIFVYQFSFGWAIAIGFVLLIFVHELGHVIANLHYRLAASAPLFIPYLGAVINLRQNPPNARVEAIVGIAGPVAGAMASLAAFGYFLATGSEAALILSWFGFTMNLFNLLPVPPLDGGRVAAAISPWIWVIGLAVMGGMLWEEVTSRGGPGVLLLVLVFALPRIFKTLKPSGRAGPYYAIGRRASFAIAAAYLALLCLLAGLRYYTQRLLPSGGLF